MTSVLDLILCRVQSKCSGSVDVTSGIMGQGYPRNGQEELFFPESLLVSLVKVKFDI